MKGPFNEKSSDKNTKNKPDDQIAALHNIDITAQLLENITHYSLIVSDKILLLVKMIWQQKSLHLFEHIALQHMYKNKKSYVFNDLNTKHIGPNGPIGVNFDTYLQEILDPSGWAINMKNLLKKIETDDQVIEYFKSPHIMIFC